MGLDTDSEAILSLEEFGILCFTNSYYLDDELKNGVEVVLTSRQSYFWVPVFCHMIKKTNLPISDIKTFIEVSLNSMVTKNDAQWNNRALGVEGMLADLEAMLFYTTRLKFEDPVMEHQSLFGTFIDEMMERLEKHNLIIDNYVEPLAGAPGVMLGLLPLGFTKRTQIGEEMYLKFNNMFRKMELLREVKNSPYEHHYRFHSIWEHFRSSIFTMEANEGKYERKKS